MKETLSKFFLAAVAMFLSVGVSASAQSGVVPQQPATTPEPAAQQPRPPQDPIAQLNLTPEQRQQIRAIRMESVEERGVINRRVRETKLALDDALNASPPDEALIESRAREAGEARAAQLRFQAKNEARIRRVLTPEQNQKLRELQLLVQQNRRQQRLENRQEGRQNLPNQRNGILSGRRNAPLKRPRP